MVEIPDAGHTPMLEAHERLNDLLRAFTARVFAR
jgi:pimeloyl-ACP methyl ester carboxylesterase